MPIEIRELIIKAIILAQGGSPASEGGKGAAGAGADNGGSQKEEIIKASLERVMDILKDKHER
jgi:hypothetical protein